MKLAYFSPMPCAKTGVATYSCELLPALARHFEITVFAPAPVSALPAGVGGVDFVTDPHVLKTLPAYDRALYHLGNNPWFHRDVLRAFRLWPDAVVLHDTVLYYLTAGGGRGALLDDLLRTDGEGAWGALDDIVKASPEGDPLRYPTPSRHPGLSRILDAARQVVVHNRESSGILRRMGYPGEVDVIPHLHYAETHAPPPPAEVRAKRSAMGYPDDAVVFGAFGFIGPTKRLDKVLQAFARLVAADAGQNMRLLIAGEGEPIAPMIQSLGLERRVTLAGFVDDAEFRRLIASVDVVLNLRYPSHGESSGSLVQAMSYGRPCIVTDAGSFAEFPDDTVVKITHGQGEVEALEVAMRRLAEDADARRRLGAAAAAHVRRQHAPDVVAREYREALARLPSLRVDEAPPAAPGDDAARIDAGDYFASRVRSLVPRESS